jgi:hypothetical protein
MTRLLSRLWDDDDGGVISVELVLIISILIFGLIPGFVALRNSGIAFMTTLGNLMNAIIPSFTFSGFAILAQDSSGTTYTVVQVNGVSFTPSPQYLTGSQTPPMTVDPAVLVPPSP